MAVVELVCSCGELVQANVWQSTFAGRLDWALSYQCASCGAVVEADGCGLPPDKYRNAILRQEGVFQVVLENSGDRKVLVVKALREVMGLSLLQANALLKSLEGVIYTGTEVECQRILSVLNEAGRGSGCVRQIQSTVGEKRKV